MCPARRYLLIWVCLLTSAFAVTSALALTSALAADSKLAAPHAPTRLRIRSGTLLGSGGATIELRAFEADVADGNCDPSKRQAGDKVVLIRAGDVFLSNESLGRLLTDKLKDHNLTDIKVSNNKGKVKVTGTAKKAVSVPFTIEGPVTLTDKGLIRLEMATMKVAHLPKGVAEFLGIDPEKMAGDGQVKGVSMEKNAIAFDPDLLWDLPVHGRVRRLAVEKNGLRLIYGKPATEKPRAAIAGATIAWHRFSTSAEPLTAWRTPGSI